MPQFCPKKMRLNEFKNVDVPTVRQLYSRFGERTKLSGYTTSLEKAGEMEPVPMSESKLASVNRAVSYAMKQKIDDDLPE